jgi:DNA-binding response OmpR family regulator
MNERKTAKEQFDLLLVDDDPELLLVIGELLRARGFTVATASDAALAMKHLDEALIRLIILDINLAGEDGVRWMTFMKKNHPTIPVILYTGLSHDEIEVKTMLGKGASCYVNKAQLPAALLFAVREVLATAPDPTPQAEAA